MMPSARDSGSNVKRIGLHIYRQYYGKSPLKDIWDKISNVLVDAGVADAEQIGLQLTEWLRTTWGGHQMVDRHRDQPLGYSRFDLLQDQAQALLSDSTLATEIVRIVRVDYRRAYLPKVKALDLLTRDIDIFNRGNSHSKIERLGTQNNISTRRVYQINKQMIECKKNWEEPMLPGVA